MTRIDCHDVLKKSWRQIYILFIFVTFPVICNNTGDECVYIYIYFNGLNFYFMDGRVPVISLALLIWHQIINLWGFVNINNIFSFGFLKLARNVAGHVGPFGASSK